MVLRREADSASLSWTKPAKASAIDSDGDFFCFFALLLLLLSVLSDALRFFWPSSTFALSN
jgi:hypothetical protein